MSKVSILLAVVLTTVGVGEAFAQCNSGVCQTRTVTRPVVRLERVCVTNFRGCQVQRVRLAVKCKTRTRTRMVRRSCCQCQPACAPSVPTEAGAYYQVSPQATPVIEPAADPNGQIQVIPNQPVAPPQPKTDTSAPAPATQIDQLDLSDSGVNTTPFADAKAPKTPNN